jgi:hypothetical protein
MNEVDHFMSRLMSNLDGSKDAKIATLVAALTVAADRLEARGHALGAREARATIAVVGHVPND